MIDPAYQRLGLPATASPYTVLRAAVRALHPDTRAVRGFRTARKRFYTAVLYARLLMVLTGARALHLGQRGTSADAQQAAGWLAPPLQWSPPASR